jgi:hypothetical protein
MVGCVTTTSFIRLDNKRLSVSQGNHRSGNPIVHREQEREREIHGSYQLALYSHLEGNALAVPLAREQLP